jgi:hypothetical protein
MQVIEFMWRIQRNCHRSSTEQSNQLNQIKSSHHRARSPGLCAFSIHQRHSLSSASCNVYDDGRVSQIFFWLQKVLSQRGTQATSRHDRSTGDFVYQDRWHVAIANQGSMGTLPQPTGTRWHLTRHLPNELVSQDCNTDVPRSWVLTPSDALRFVLAIEVAVHVVRSGLRPFRRCCLGVHWTGW